MSNLTSLQPLGDIEVLVSYIVIPGEPERGPESRDAGPGCRPIVRVIDASIWSAPGRECAYTDLPASTFAPAIVQGWEEAILNEIQD